MTLTLGSLFSGIGGIDLAFERAGFDCRWQVELNPHPRSVLDRHWPNVPSLHDVQEVHAHDPRSCTAADPDHVCPACGGVARVDVLVGGFPCQDLSVAGGRAGLAGSRSGLWWHFARLIAELAPRWCVVENVPGLLSSNDGRDFGTVIGTLGDLGYGHAWRVLDAQWFGLPQRRERVVIVGCAGDWTGPAQVLLEPETGGGHPPAIDEKEARAALRAGRRPRSGRRRGGVLADGDLVSTLTGGMSTGGPDLTPAQAGHYVVDRAGAILAQGTGGRGHRLEPDGVNLIIEERPVVFRKTHKAADVEDSESWVEDDAVQTLNASDAHRPNEVIVSEVVPLSLRHAANDVGAGAGTPSLGDGAPGGPSSTILANVPPAVAYAVAPEGGQGADIVVKETEIAQTLTAGVLARNADRQPIIHQHLVVRRLLPVECLRLQGFPDGWVGEHNDLWARPDGLSDSAAYAAAGNAVAVPVFHWLAVRLGAHHHAAQLDQLAPHDRQPFTMPELIDLEGGDEVETVEQGALW